MRTDVVDGRRPAIGRFEAFSQSAEIEKMVQQSPEDAEAWYALGRARLLSGRPERAGEAYARAMELFLRQRQEEGAVRAYDGLKEHREGAAVAEGLRFPLACALAERAHAEDAFRLFWDVAKERPKGAQTETAPTGVPGWCARGRLRAVCLGMSGMLGRAFKGCWRSTPMGRGGTSR